MLRFRAKHKSNSMKKLLLFIVLIISNNILSAQSERHYVAFSAGPSFPLSDFSKTDLLDSASGFAKTGLFLKMTYAYKISHNFGIQAKVVFNTNNYDTEAMKTQLDQQFPDYPASINSARPWNSGGLYASPFLRIPLDDRFVWEIKGTIGLSGAYSPQLSIKSAELPNGHKLDYYRESAKAFGFGYGFGTSFYYKLSKYLIFLNADYYSSQMKFKEVNGWGYPSDEFPDGKEFLIDIDQNISTYSISIGIGYFL